MNFTTPPSFASQGLTPGTRLALCVVTSLALLIGDSQFNLMERVRDAVSVVLYPLQRAANVPLYLAGQASDYLTTQRSLMQENENLRERDLIQSAKLMRMSTLERELAQLQALLNLESHADRQGTVAEVLYTGRDPFSHRIIIDKGSNQGLRNGQAVIDENGLIGQITRVQPISAEVTLVINRRFIVPVMIQRTGQRALLYGYGGGTELRYLPITADITADDVLVTSGVDGIYQPGLPVARVAQIDKLSGAAFARVRAKVLAGVQSSRYVVVLPERPAMPAAPAETAPVKPNAGQTGHAVKTE